MRYETLSDMMRRRKADKASGKRHEPLHTLKECCEAAGVSPQWFGRWAAQYPGAPKPVQGVYHNHRTPYYSKREVVQWIKQLKEQLSNQKGTFIMPSLQDALKQAIDRASAVPSEWDDEPTQPTPQTAQTAQTTQPQETSVQPTQTPRPTVPSSAFKPTNNVTRETFNYVRDNPGISRIKATNDLVAKGFSAKTVSALISQMVQQEMFHRDNHNCLRALVPEYTPLKTYSTVVTQKLAELMPRAHLRMVMRDGKRMLVEDKPKSRKKAADTPKRKYTRRAKVVETVQTVPLPVTMVEEPVVVAPAASPVVEAPVVKPQVTGKDILNQLTLVQAKELHEELKRFFNN